MVENRRPHRRGVQTLTRQTIILDHKIPHIRIPGPDGRQIKTKQIQRRDIPPGRRLASWRCKAQPEGFPGYHDKADLVSATVNKFFKGKTKLLPNGEDTLFPPPQLEDRTDRR